MIQDDYSLCECSLHKKMKFSIKDFFSKCDQLVTFTEVVHNRKLHFCVVVFMGKWQREIV